VGADHQARSARQHDDIARRKARFVVDGHLQRPGIDYTTTYAPVAQLTSLRTMCALIARNRYGWCTRQLDVVCAFVQAQTKEEVYVAMPAGFTQPNPDPTGPPMVLRLRRSLYGLTHCRRQLEGSGTTPSSTACCSSAASSCARTSDPCIFHHPITGIILIVYVDDIGITGTTDAKAIDALVDAFAARFPIKDLGTGRLEYYLGLHITVNDGGVTLDQNDDLRGLLERHSMLTCAAQRTPMAAPRSGDPALHASADEALDESGAQEYHAMVGGMLWLSICTRPDISYAVSQLARHMRAPAVPHMVAAKRVLRYLSGAQFGLQYTRQDTPMPLLHCYADAAFGTDVMTRKSISGFVLMLEGAAVYWKSKLQSTVAASTTECEFIALFHASRAVDSLRVLLKFVGVEQHTQSGRLPPMCLRTTAARSPSQATLCRRVCRARFDVKYYYVREMVSTRVVNVVHVHTENHCWQVEACGAPSHSTSQCPSVPMRACAAPAAFLCMRVCVTVLQE
jgi:Reverse transcriptase (RNA-dependent DNA polymerase)